jgi:hypothetical protein
MGGRGAIFLTRLPAKRESPRMIEAPSKKTNGFILFGVSFSLQKNCAGESLLLLLKPLKRHVV